MIPGERHTILIVDDEPENLDLLERTFGFDYDIVRAKDGEEALELLPRISSLALIITDQRMPRVSGTELLKRARSVRGDALRIILTGYTDPVDLIEAINASNVYRYLTKPWDVEHLRAVVERAVRRFQVGGGDLVDDVTGLPNRGWLRCQLGREVARAAHANRGLAIEILEVTGYPAVAAEVGVLAAEHLLRTVGDELQRVVRPIDIVGVWGEGAFVVILPEPPPELPLARVRRAIIDSPAFTEMTWGAHRPDLRPRSLVWQPGQSAEDVLRAGSLLPPT